jgi:ABC-type proline/glycine betaine transport system ATPase subunit
MRCQAYCLLSHAATITNTTAANTVTSLLLLLLLLYAYCMPIHDTGAGKTTLLSMLSGDTHPSSGSATICGFDVATQQPLLRRRIGYCPQFDAMLELLSVREHIELYARYANCYCAVTLHLLSQRLQTGAYLVYSNSSTYCTQ